jgi:hypothetical protein
VETSSYSFSGLSGSLDHVLVNQGALDRATGADIWNINSGESVALEYSRYNTHGTLFFAPDPYRSSDHDPVVLALDPAGDAPAVTLALTASAGTQVWGAAPVTLSAAIAGPGAAEVRTVEFASGETTLGSAPVIDGVATLTLPVTLTPGEYAVRATAVGADTDVLAVSPVAPVTVTASATTLVLVPVRIGVVQIVLAVVTPDAGGLAPRGSVTLESGQQAGTTRILRGGVTLFVPRAAGEYSARYLPQGNTFHLPAARWRPIISA